jgi:23S rRNA pseudouridine2605 synthase
MSTDDSTPNGAPGEGERIAKVLSRAGIASRRDAERLVLEGRVTVNGDKITSPATNVTPKDRLEVDGQPVAEAEATRIWLYHKPAGLVTTEHDEEGRPTVFDSLPDDMPRVMSVGRLDLTSEGLLLLTNDGEIKRKLELPSTGWSRRYRVRIHGTPTNDQLQPLRQGVTVDDMDCQPMEVEIDRQQGSNCWLTITLREGKNREIRRVMEHLGFTVNRLIRVSYGPFQLGELPSGEVEEVRAKIVRDQLGLAKPKAEPGRTRKRVAPEDMPVFDAEPGERPERERLATPRPEGATVKRELKGRVPKPRGERTEEEARPRGLPRLARKPSGGFTGGPFSKPRTWMRADEARAAREEAPEEDRPARPRAVPGDKPRSAGYKSHGKPGGEDRPRSAGFKSHRDEGDRPARPYRPREEGDRPQRSFRDRPEGDRGPRRDAGDRPYRPREEGGDRPARGFKPREGGDRPYKPREGGGDRPYKPREGGDRPYERRGDGERPARASSPRPQRDGGDRPARPYKPREEGDRPQRSFRDRPEGDRGPRREGGDRPYKPREGGDRPYKPRAPREEGGDRPARGFKPREGGDRPARPYKPREGGDRPQRDFKPSSPARDGDRPARGFKPREGGDSRPPRSGGAPRPGGAGGARKGPPRAGGFKGPRKG